MRNYQPDQSNNDSIFEIVLEFRKYVFNLKSLKTKTYTKMFENTVLFNNLQKGDDTFLSQLAQLADM